MTSFLPPLIEQYVRQNATNPGDCKRILKWVVMPMAGASNYSGWDEGRVASPTFLIADKMHVFGFGRLEALRRAVMGNDSALVEYHETPIPERCLDGAKPEEMDVVVYASRGGNYHVLVSRKFRNTIHKLLGGKYTVLGRAMDSHPLIFQSLRGEYGFAIAPRFPEEGEMWWDKPTVPRPEVVQGTLEE